MCEHLEHKVRQTPRRPRSWANRSLLSLYSHRNARANLHLLGQLNTVLALQGAIDPFCTASASMWRTSTDTLQTWGRAMVQLESLVGMGLYLIVTF